MILSEIFPANEIVSLAVLITSDVAFRSLSTASLRSSTPTSAVETSSSRSEVVEFKRVALERI